MKVSREKLSCCHLWTGRRTVVFFDPTNGVVDEHFVDALHESRVVDVAAGGVGELATQ